MVRGWIAAVFSVGVVACGSAEVDVSGADVGAQPAGDDSGTGATDSSVTRDAAYDVARIDASVDAATDVAADAGADVSTDANAPDARDASFEASPDSGSDAHVDSGVGVVDSGAEASVDAAVNPNVCSIPNESRCRGYYHDHCEPPGWVQDYSEVCCTNPTRWVTDPKTFNDTVTGLTWTRDVASGVCSTFPSCDSLVSSRNIGTGWRRPTMNELSQLVIGQPDSQGHNSACTPTLDQVAFRFSSSETLYLAQDGWFDMDRGIPQTTGTVNNCAVACVHD